MTLTLDAPVARNALATDRPTVVFHAGEALVVAAAHQASTTTVAFLVRHSSGFLQIALPRHRCEHLQLPPMHPFDPAGSRMCVGVDAVRGTGTGISAADRATTARALVDPAAAPGDFTRPGHLIPVCVDPGETDRPTTAAAIALDLAGRPDGALFAGLVGLGDPTRMMNYPECAAFSRRHALPLITIR